MKKIASLLLLVVVLASTSEAAVTKEFWGGLFTDYGANVFFWGGTVLGWQENNDNVKNLCYQSFAKIISSVNYFATFISDA
mmetsp:Transcript_26381/g.25548  ORF Transcript_26381/g.25548 Transcript_26381/m.25548 type:complete len:81 (-) Transcript_26381:437-679(-)